GAGGWGRGGVDRGGAARAERDCARVRCDGRGTADEVGAGDGLRRVARLTTRIAGRLIEGAGRAPMGKERRKAYDRWRHAYTDTERGKDDGAAGICVLDRSGGAGGNGSGCERFCG